MKIIKCPSCGYVMKDGETRYACPKCGCSAENFIVIGETDTIVNNYSTLSNEQKNKMGYNQSNQPIKNYDVICPDCNSVIIDENLDCPNCGCPSNLFKQHPQKPSTQKKSSFTAILTTIIIIGVIGIGGVSYWVYCQAQEHARYEQYQKEQQAQREREYRKEMEIKKQVEREIEQAFTKFTGTYSSNVIDGGSQSGRGRFYITFYSDKTFDLRFVDAFTGNRLQQQSGTYTFYYQESPNKTGMGQLLDYRGNRINYYYINSLGYSISINGYELTK